MGSGNAEAFCERKAVRRAANAAAEAVFRVFTQTCNLEKKRILKARKLEVSSLVSTSHSMLKVSTIMVRWPLRDRAPNDRPARTSTEAHCVHNCQLVAGQALALRAYIPATGQRP